MNQKRSVYYGFELKGSDNQVYGNYSVNTPLIEFIDNIKKIQFNNYILLYRKNYLKQYVSYYFARQSKIHHTKTIQNKLKTLNINTHNCLWFKENKTLTDHFNYLDDFYNKVKKNLLHDEFLQINYEDDILNNPIIAYKKICNFIGINYETPSVTLRKTNPFPLADIIENYSEVENYMRGTKYEWMLYN